MAGLFAFQSARASVVTVAQPTETSLRTPTGRPRPPTRRRGRRRREAQPAGRHGPEEIGARARAGAAASRALPRIARPTATPAAPAIRSDAALDRQNDEQRQQRREQAVEHLTVEMHVVPDEVRVKGREQRRRHAERAGGDGGADRIDEQRCPGRDADLDQRHGGPRVAERPVDRGQEECVERLRVARWNTGKEAEGAAVRRTSARSGHSSPSGRSAAGLARRRRRRAAAARLRGRP